MRNTSDLLSLLRIAIRLVMISCTSDSRWVLAYETTAQYIEPSSPHVVESKRLWYRRMVVEGGRNDTMLSNPSWWSWWVTRWRDEKLLTTPRRHHKSPTGTVSMLPRIQLLDYQGQWYVDLNMNIRQSFTISWASLISHKDIYHCLPRPRWPKEQCLSSAELANTI